MSGTNPPPGGWQSPQPPAGWPSPQGPGWWQASDGRWYPPPGPQVPVGPPPKSSNKGCIWAAVIVGGLLVLGAISAFIIVAVVADRVDDAVDEVGSQNPDELDDAELVDCGTDDGGFMVATVRVTNDSPERSSYFIDVEFESEDGDEQFATTVATVSGVDPDQSAEAEANSFEEPPASDFECRIEGVNRFSDE